MTWYAPGLGKKAGQSRTSIKKGAVPLGQHSHSPEAVLGTKPRPVRIVPGVIHQPPLPRTPAPPTGVYAGLPAPAPREAGCCSCARTAALVDPATGRGFCSDCWLRVVVMGQIE